MPHALQCRRRVIVDQQIDLPIFKMVLDRVQVISHLIEGQGNTYPHHDVVRQVEMLELSQVPFNIGL